jgi:uncharacterized OB-fold protein
LAVTDDEMKNADPFTWPFWDGARAGVLRIQRCRNCGRHQFYPRPHCLGCESDRVEWVAASGRGTVHSLTTVHVAPTEEFAVPYDVALVELAEGPRLLMQTASATSIGTTGMVGWRARGEAPPVPHFHPDGAAQ